MRGAVGHQHCTCRVAAVARTTHPEAGSCRGRYCPGCRIPSGRCTTDAEVDAEGNLLEDDTPLLLFNVHSEAVDFRLPGEDGTDWDVLVDTCASDGRSQARLPAGAVVQLCDRALLLLRRPSG